MEKDRNAVVKEGFYARIFARVYDPFMESMERKVLSHYRRRLLAPLKGEVLEVGCGTGVNFPYYPRQCHVVATEPSVHMLKQAVMRKGRPDVVANIEPVHAGIGSERIAEHVPPTGFDAIVCTLVLCTIPEPEDALRRMCEWLKPDGKLIVLEHVRPRSRFRQAVHGLIDPVWNHLAEGCHLNRDTVSLLKKVGLTPEWEQHFLKVLPFYVAVMSKQS